MFEVTEQDIAAEMRVFPGLDKLQARNRIKQRRFFNAQNARSLQSRNWIK